MTIENQLKEMSDNEDIEDVYQAYLSELNNSDIDLIIQLLEIIFNDRQLCLTTFKDIDSILYKVGLVKSKLIRLKS